MVRCADCRFEGRYNIERDGDGIRYMRCNAPDGGPTTEPISFIEGLDDESCDFFVAATEAEMQIKAQFVSIEGAEQKTFEGMNLDTARAQAIIQMPDGMLAVREQVVSEGLAQSTRMTGETAEAAFAKALLSLPVETRITGRREISPARREILDIGAKNETEAATLALADGVERWGANAVVGRIHLVKKGKKGFFGVVGSEKTHYNVEISTPAVVELTYRTPVTVAVQYSAATYAAMERVKVRESLRRESAAKDQVPLAQVTLQTDNLEDVVRRCPPSSVFMTALQADQPIVLLRMDGLPQVELSRMKQTVASNRVVFVPQLILDEQYPLLGMSFFIYDNPLNPYVAKAFGDIMAGDVQEFLLAVARTGIGQLLFYDAAAQLLASGTFALVMPAAGDRPSAVMFPIRQELKDLMMLGKMIQTAATQLKGIPEDRRDFLAATQRHDQ